MNDADLRNLITRLNAREAECFAAGKIPRSDLEHLVFRHMVSAK